MWFEEKVNEVALMQFLSSCFACSHKMPSIMPYHPPQSQAIIGRGVDWTGLYLEAAREERPSVLDVAERPLFPLCATYSTDICN